MSVSSRAPVLPGAPERRRVRLPGARRRHPWRWVAGLLAAAVFATALLFLGVAVRIWQVGREDHRPHSDAILVLGAAQYNGVPSPTLAARLDHALILYREGVAPVIVTVGGKEPADRYTEAQSGVAYLEQHGVPSSALVGVGQGRDTLQSLKAADVVFKAHHWTTVVLVTDPWHEFRSQAMARDLGLRTATSPTHTGPASQGRLTEVHYIGRETLGYFYYRLFDRFW